MKENTPPQIGGTYKTVNRHSSLICCACSCISGQIMIVYSQLTKLDFVGEIILKCYYHGSCTPGIMELEARSKLHTTAEKVVYLTDNIPYALFYLWDAEHNGCSVKHVTGWTKNDTAYYEEQFPDQLKTFYQGVSGYLYCVKIILKNIYHY